MHITGMGDKGGMGNAIYQTETDKNFFFFFFFRISSFYGKPLLVKSWVQSSLNPT